MPPLKDNELVYVFTLPPLVTTSGEHWWVKRFPIHANLAGYWWWLKFNLTHFSIKGNGCARCGVHCPPTFCWPPFFFQHRWWKAHESACPGEVEGMGR